VPTRFLIEPAWRSLKPFATDPLIQVPVVYTNLDVRNHGGPPLCSNHHHRQDMKGWMRVCLCGLLVAAYALAVAQAAPAATVRSHAAETTSPQSASI
jgi:hypothetical protein